MKRFAWLILMTCLLSGLGGCQGKQTQEWEGTPVEFEMVEMREVPQELADIIEENQKDEIRMTFVSGEDMYLVRGYGEQKTGGYSICVKSCTQDEEMIWLDTQLIGPQNPETVKEDPSYPCLVIKLPKQEKEVMIQ